MYQKFNSDNIVTKFIKNILNSTNIPMVNVWKPGKPLIKDLFYITDKYIIQAIKNDDGTHADIFNSKYIKIIEPYIWGKQYNGLTTKFVSNNSIYDSNTHYYLGEYLRMVRDLYGIDLMGYYNCWSGVYSDTIRIQNNSFISNNTTSDGLSTLIVPIKFNTLYTIFINSNVPIKIGTCYYKDDKILSSSSQEYSFLNSSNIEKLEVINNCSFYKPYIFKGIPTTTINTEEHSATLLLEQYLTMIVQIPNTLLSSILILEGEYKDINLINNNTHTNALKNQILNYAEPNLEIDDSYYTSALSLTRTFTSDSYAFNDRLLEYLLLNVIDKNDQNSCNIERVQENVSSNNSYIKNGLKYSRENYITGIWDDNLRKFIYDLDKTNKFKKLVVDINGYVDKDTEEVILRGKS